MDFPSDRLEFLIKLTGAVAIIDEAKIPYEKKYEYCFGANGFWDQFNAMNIVKAPDFRCMGQGKEVANFRRWLSTRTQAYLSARYGEVPTIGKIFAAGYAND